MKILMAGASGMIGRGLIDALECAGHEIFRLVRRDGQGMYELEWNPAKGLLNVEHLVGVDAVICLSGEGIADGRWNPQRKGRILNSRVQSVRLLAETMAKCSSPPRILICASAIGYYDTRHGDESLDESSPPGDDFLAQVCREWEEAAKAAAGSSVRVVHLRLGVVLGKDGGVLARMLLPFRLGIGGKLGSGMQWMSWVCLSDVVRAIVFAIDNEEIRGPVNVTAPNPVRNIEFTRELAKSLHRFAPFGVPGLAIRILFGEMGESLLLNGARVMPECLMKHGFVFEYSTIDEALRELV